MKETQDTDSRDRRRLNKALLLKKITEIAPLKDAAITDDDGSLTPADSPETQTENSTGWRDSKGTSQL